MGVRYSDLDSLCEDILRLSRQRLETVEKQLRCERELEEPASDVVGAYA